MRTSRQKRFRDGRPTIKLTSPTSPRWKLSSRKGYSLAASGQLASMRYSELQVNQIVFVVLHNGIRRVNMLPSSTFN
ncbi:hypothetical protein TTRE_0000947501 [Trichuris trichiura]|uniref:Uncharacterized protein n=1 Tax=Trichuris trichiura TaxID=36087 RepID=A0A077ZMS9_TRITR|nr:hypothetical protein TTRE_0000947501 [Trichuris trichiura]